MYFLLSIVAFILATVTAEDDFSYQVAVEHEGGFLLCHGAIVNEHWIVTIVSCAPDNPAKPMAVVRVGSDKKQYGGTVHQIEDIIKHEKYKINKGGFNEFEIALIRLKEPIVFDDHTKKIPLLKVTEKLNPGTSAFVTGFGHAGRYTNQLQKLEMPVVDLGKCNQDYEAEGGLPKGCVCASYEKITDLEQKTYDLGAPLIVDEPPRLAGLFYKTIRNAEGFIKRPVIFTDITYYQQWIDHCIHLTSKKYD